MKKFVFIFITTVFVFGIILFITIIGIYSYVYSGKVFPGVYIAGQHTGNWTKEEVSNFFKEKNLQIGDTKFTFTWEDSTSSAAHGLGGMGKKWATTGTSFNYKFDEEKISDEVYKYGRSGNFFADFSSEWIAFWSGVSLPSEILFDEKGLSSYLSKIALEIDIAPVEGLFDFQDGRVTAFRISSDGRALDIPLTTKMTREKISSIPQSITILLPVKTVKPKVPTDEANNLGIKELIGKGESFFKDSIPSRVYNIKLGASKFHGITIPPGEIFSFNENIGTVSAYTGYEQAYVIEKGKTVLGDGGGVCQVSSTLFRAALYSGLPIIERIAHSYRVSYYEPPVGFDATVYDPAPDFKFKNDTGKNILIQTIVDNEEKKLTFEFYGTKDGREVIISDPVITSQAPAPKPTYQDDPTLAKGAEKQIDTAHSGASVYFTRKVTRKGETLIDETIRSNYIPWAAVILRGTKE